jgi:hypothetical protein
MIKDIDQDTFNGFSSLTSQLSPENLHCDGEASKSYVNQKLRTIRKEWKALEKKVGRKVSEHEIEMESIRSWRES